MSKNKNKKQISSNASLAEKDTPETQPIPSTPTDEVLTFDDVTANPPDEITRIAAEAEEETPGDDTDTDEDQDEAELPKGIAETFKACPHIKAAYVKDEKWFFDKRIAKQVFKTFDVIENPYFQDEE